MKTILFTYPHERCPNCLARLKVYRKIRRNVKLVNWEFTAIHRIKICPVDRTIFRSDELDKIVPLMCSLYYLDSYKRDNILLKVYKGESRGGFANLLHSSRGKGDAHA